MDPPPPSLAASAAMARLRPRFFFFSPSIATSWRCVWLVSDVAVYLLFGWYLGGIWVFEYGRETVWW